MTNRSSINIKVFGLLIGILLIGSAVYQLITHPITNKRIVERAIKNLNDNKAQYDKLTNYLNHVEKNHYDFYLENNPKQGLICETISTIDSPSKKIIDLQIPIFMHDVMVELGIDIIKVYYNSNPQFAIFYRDKFSYSITGKNVQLYYFPFGYIIGYFPNDIELFDTKQGKTWLYKINDNWILKSESIK
jgi:hypothetical protein